ncbi:hypothetical protein L3N51_01332 [Metallosphaera sp. J1]|uniref:CARDB domain-containing protein n=1 Tax=Metallosphaera javensis (ex Hofmann et al. 2022) TaxID=99938 RepID=UPI001EE12A07|nr:CARDB domain-containing protein [Metallosphaera javensis (ex Hofmann et al. 2022)]MCG3109042.1 hypothetical protein [Metallosphaera javensis (ex Hofmann et al. 2022)]
MRQILGFSLLFLLMWSFIGLIAGTFSVEASTTPTYNVTFVESGLPAGTMWSVTFNGQTKNSTTNEITFQVQGEAYPSFSIPDVGRYIPTPSQGQILVNSSLTINVTFALPFVKLVITKLEVVQQSTGTTVTELQPGTSYVVGVDVQNQGNVNALAEANETILLNGKLVTSDVPIASISPGATDTLSFVWTPSTSGIYTFLVNVKASPNISISASYPLYVGVSPQKTYNVSFVETGLAQGTEWSVTLNGTVKSSTSNTITFQVPSGTYTYTIGNVTGYLAKTVTGKLTVVNGSITVQVTFLPLVFRPVATLYISYNGQQVTQLKTNTTYDLIVGVKNEGNATGQGYVLVVASQGSITVLNKALNYTLKPGQAENFTLLINLNSTSPLSVSLTTYSSTPKGEVPVYNSSSQFTVIQQPTTTKTTTSTNTTTNTTTPTKTNTTTPTTTNTTSPPTPKPSSSSSNTTLIIGIAVIVIVIIAIAVIFLRRK